MAETIEYVRYISYLKNCLRRRGKTREDAEDLVQEAFLRLELYCQKGHEVSEPGAFLMRTVRNLSVSQHRRELLLNKKNIEDIPLADSSVAPDEVLAAEERLEAIRQILDGISRRTREVFFLTPPRWIQLCRDRAALRYFGIGD